MTSNTKGLGVQASAFFHAALRGVERGAMGFAILFVLLFLGSLSVSLVESSIWTQLGCGVGLAGLLGTLVTWVVSIRSQESELPATTVSMNEQGLFVNAPVRDPMKLIAELRTQIHGRDTLPPPHGSVDARGDGVDSWEVRKYSEQERKQVMGKIRSSVAAHDDRVLNQLAAIEQKLAKLPHIDEDPDYLEQAGELKEK